ncbi:MAG TPA: hypothetical protein VNA65_02775 [Candidatus Dormibacteraeota bacterium]|nr:hypothetical protein [Candidatus Dormibacteraeota bacterium]
MTLLIGGLIGAGTMLGATQVRASMDRPTCAETVMKAVSTDKPVNGSFECFDSSYRAGLQHIGIDSDNTFASQVGKNGEYHYLHKTADGGYVYEYDRARSPHDRFKGTVSKLGLPSIVAALQRGDFYGAWHVPNDFEAAWSEITGDTQNESSELFTFYMDHSGKITFVK